MSLLLQVRIKLTLIKQTMQMYQEKITINLYLQETTMDQVDRYTITKMEFADVSTNCILGWQGCYLGIPVCEKMYYRYAHRMT